MLAHQLTLLITLLAMTVAIDATLKDLFVVRRPSRGKILATTRKVTPPTTRPALNRPTSPAQSFKAIQAFLMPPRCARPFEAAGGLCLLFNNKTLTWRQAEKFCVAKGAHLVWMRSLIEHNVIRGFVQTKQHANYFWTGLHRSGNDSHVWSSGIVSSYRGTPFTEQNMTFISADSRDRQFDGDGKDMRLKSVCRQKTRNDGQPVNLMMILENNRMEIEDMVKAIGIFTMKKFEAKLERMATAINKGIVECPSPWIRTKNMCLLYIFQLRTWPEAEDLCTVQGGTLAWFDSKAEMYLIRTLSWARHKRIYKYFWIGLHKGISGKFIWTGHNSLAVRPKSGSVEKYVAMNRESGSFIYGDDSNKFSAVCRRLI